MADEFAQIKEMLLGSGAFRQVNLAPLGDKILGGHGSVANSASISRIGMADEFAPEIWQRQFSAAVGRRLSMRWIKLRA